MKTQQGAVLIVALVMLVVISIISFTGINIPTIQEQLNVVSEDRQLAFQRAEQGLREAEKLVRELDPAIYKPGGVCALQENGSLKIAPACPNLAGLGNNYSYSGYLTSFADELNKSGVTSGGDGGASVSAGAGVGGRELGEAITDVYVFSLKSTGKSDLSQHTVVLHSLYVVE
ncbi:pilus assembly PilX family protein [Thiopseudomonas alkaliphila]|uniref:pilus assembly PilX family protein n=1 Tax=Thiopseudomonas alkaliphila TaxID=1697053 RepID=UPI002577D860|nr:hypothetical protein [Thiopseudomonas alkaliphila]MDM1708348.1 hypothetical protein [Thiopseudomonas alkaliphila]